MPRTTTDPVAAVAAVLVGLETLGLLVLTGWQIVALVGGDVAEVPSALALIVLTLAGAVILGAFAFAVARGQSWGRSGAIVFQLLLLAVAGGAMTGTYAVPLLGVELAVPALVTLALVIWAARRAAPRRDESAGDATAER